MPIYIYKCEDCGDIFEYFVAKTSDKPECGKCGSHNLTKLPSTFGVKMGSSTGGSCPTGTCGLG